MRVTSVLLYQIFLLGKHEINNSGTQCVDQLVENLLSPGTGVNFVFAVNLTLTSTTPVPVILWNGYNAIKCTTVEAIPLYVIQTTAEELEGIFKKLEETWCFYPKATFVLLTEQIGVKIFETLAKYYVTSVAVVNNNGEVFTYTPYIFESIDAPYLNYSKISYGDARAVVDKITNCEQPRKWRNTTISTLFYPVAPFVFFCQNCTKLSDMSGIEIEIYKEIQKRLGFKVNCSFNVEFDWGIKFNSTYTYGLGQLQRREVDAMMGACNMNREEHLDFDVTASYCLDTCNWVVPRTRALSTWTRYIKTFSTHMWLLTLLMLIVVVVVLFVKLGKLGTALFTTFQILVESAVSNIHSISNDVRSIILLITLGSLVISTVFKNRMFVILSSTKLRNSIETFDDLLDSDIQILLTPRMVISVMSNTVSPREQTLFTRMHDTPDLNHIEQIDKVAFEKDSATVSIRGLTLYFIKTRYLKDDGDPQIYILQEPKYNLHIQMFFLKGYPVKERISNYFLYNVQNGLIGKEWRDKVYDITKDVYRRQVYVFGAQKLGIAGLLWCFYLLGWGMLLATLVFVCELLIDKLQVN